VSSLLTATVRQRAALALGLPLIVAGAILVSPLGQAFGDRGPAPIPPALAGEDTSGDVGVALPSLSPTQEAEARALAEANPAIRALTKAGRISTLVVPWTTADGSRLLGAGIDITWEQPVAVAAARWPLLFYDETEQASPPYQSTTGEISATDVTGVHVSIDLEGHRVLGLNPMPGAVVTREQVDPNFHNTLPPQPKNPR
jgi:hypothetical protein